MRKTSLMALTLTLIMIGATNIKGFGSPYQALIRVGSAGAATSQSPCDLYDGLLLVVNNTRQLAEEVVHTLQGEGRDTESLMDKLNAASEAFDEAMSLREAGLCEEASALLSEALHEYGEVFSEALDFDSQDDDSYEEAVEAIEYGEKVERAYVILNNTWDIVHQLQAKGLDVTPIQDVLNQTDEKIWEAEAAIMGNDFELGEDLLLEVEELLDHAYELMEEVGRPKMTEKIESFLNKTRERVEKLETRITGILNQANVSQEVLDALKAEFQEVYEKFEAMNVTQEPEDLEEILEDLDDLFEEIEDTYEILEEEMNEVREYLEELEKYEAWIDYTEENIASLEEAGFNVSDYNSLLEEVKGQIELAQGNVDDGNLQF